ncbi:MAG: radical SAM protein [Thermodesulfovibrionia bacterium]|nr:radical SAM protein [Thermodesulfovibrionia bacterium]
MKGLKKRIVAGQATRDNASEHDFFIQWHLTERCNLRCSHCYQEETIKKEMTFPEVNEVIEEVSGVLYDWAETYGIKFSPSFNITGGEPFLRKDIFEILDALRRKGFDVYLLTNGTLIHKKEAEQLSDLGIKGVQVSIEGPEAIHDTIRGKGSFALSARGIKNLLHSHIRVTLNVTLSNLNEGYIGELITFAKDIGAQRLGFSRLVPCGRGALLLNQMIDKFRVKQIYDSLLSLDVKGLEIVTGDPIASQMNIKNSSDTGCTAYGGCAAGIAGLTLLPDGTITPCRRLNIPIGNIREDSLREIWATSDVLNVLRDKNSYKGKCGKCRRWASCRGCRAIAYAYSQSKGQNDFLTEDPQCFIK